MSDARRRSRGAPPPQPVRGWLVALGLGAIVLGAYANSLDAGFTSDSEFIIRRAARVHDATWANVVDIVTTDYWWPGNVMGLYRPVTTLSYLLNWAVLGNGPRPAGYHWINLLLHWANTLVVYAIGRRVLGVGAGAAFLGAALFATHPVTTEAVTNLVGRADLLATAAVLGGLLLYATTTRMPRVLALVGVAFVGFLGLLAKESAIALLPSLLVYDLILRRRDGRHAVFALAPALAVVWAIRHAIFRGTPPTELDFAQNVLVGADWWTARLTALKIIGRSCWLLLWPVRLCADYSVNAVPLFGWRLDGIEDWQVPMAGLLVVGLLAAAAWTRRRRPAVTFVILFFLVALLPTSNLLFPIGAVMAERFLYLPLAAVALGIALAVDACAGQRARVARGALAAIIVLCALRTMRRNVDWRDDVSLWTAAVGSCPDSYRSHDALASALAGRLLTDGTVAVAGGIDRVIAEAETARTILEQHAPPGTPVPAFVLERLGSFYLSKAMAEPGPEQGAWAAKAADVLAAAAGQYAAETRARPRAGGEGLELGTPQLHEDLGLALLQAGRPEAAVDAFVHARALSAGSASAYLHLATTYARLERWDEALMSALEARLVDPGGAGSPQLVYDLYQRVDPGGCGVTNDGGQVRVHPECPAARTFVCRAYAGLVSVLAGARNTPRAERDAAIAKFRRGGDETFHCTELGFDDRRVR